MAVLRTTLDDPSAAYAVIGDLPLGISVVDVMVFFGLSRKLSSATPNLPYWNFLKYLASASGDALLGRVPYS